MPDWPFPPPLTPMEAKVQDDLPRGDWAYEPKWDGFRAVAWSGEVRLDSRNHRPLLRYFPELEAPFRALPPGTVVDGEVVVVRGDRLDFDPVQNRLHPAASRTARLARETPPLWWPSTCWPPPGRTSAPCPSPSAGRPWRPWPAACPLPGR